MKIYNNLTELIGKTPLLNLKNFNGKYNVNIAAKLEFFNPSGSVKARIAFAMIDDAEKQGVLKNDSVIIEPTSGNTGIGLAMVAAARGYKIILVMPENMSVERQKLLLFYGAQIVLTDKAKGMAGAIEKAQELAKNTKNSFIPRQFENPVNPNIHFDTTGPEIWQDTDGKIDIFVSAVGTGGTLSGSGEFLKSKNAGIKIVAVEPLNSPVLSKGIKGPHKIQGIGAGFVPKTLNTSVYDEVITVSDEDALFYSKEIARTDGILAGISSGAALCAAKQLGLKEENKNKNIIVIFPDSAERYISTELFS